MQCERVPVRYCGKLDVHIQGNLNERAGKTVFLTVHDVGANHDTFVPFVNDKHMTEVRKKAIFLHVCLPGQEDFAPELPESFVYPTMDQIAQDLMEVLDNFKVRSYIGMGEGAGANILMRFGLKYPNACLGMILIECTTEPAGFDDYLKYAVFNWKEEGMKLFDKVLHVFQSQRYEESDLKFKAQKSQDRMSEANINKLLESYMRRSDISQPLTSNHQTDILVIVGQNSPNFEMVNRMVEPLDKTITTLMSVSDVVDPLYQAPENLARALILFCKGCGVLLGVPMLGLEREFNSIKSKESLPEVPNAAKSAYTTKILAAELKMKDRVYE